MDDNCTIVAAPQRILLGVTGGIAAYKSAEIVRLLKKQGIEVKAILTQSGESFISKLTLQALTGHPVRTDLLDPNSEATMDHIRLARWANATLIAPASANFIAKLAHGLADDLLSTLCLATQTPIYVAPAMNHAMWENPATQANIEILKSRGIKLIGPDSGFQACGETGPGRMAEPSTISSTLITNLKTQNTAKEHWLITAGPTREALDPVRYISNRSSGKMGYAIAKAAIDNGANVTLVSGPCTIKPPAGLKKHIQVTTAQQMLDSVLEQLNEGVNIFVAAAAVSDYRSESIQAQKIKKNEQVLQLSLVKNPDILLTVAKHENRPEFVAGFAAESQNLIPNAREKLQKKGADLIVANDISQTEFGFDSDNNLVHLVSHAEDVTIGPATKLAIAFGLYDHILAQWRSSTHTS